MKIACHGLDCEILLSVPDTEGWMRATVTVKVPSFEGGFACAIERLEWQAFVEVLRVLAHAVGTDTRSSWNNMEENIGFAFVLKSSGRIAGTYRFSPNDPGFGPLLTGPFEADQTFLQRWQHAATEAARHER
jgi:hypothetical protein